MSDLIRAKISREGGVILFPHFLDHNFAKVSDIREIQRNIFGTWNLKPFLLTSRYLAQVRQIVRNWYRNSFNR
jgi:hypothetical protein